MKRDVVYRRCIMSSTGAVVPAAMFLLFGASAWAREITNLDVSADGATATVAMSAGEEGDSHVLYYAWSNDGVDKGADISAWPHVLRTGRVADNATEATIELPTAAAPAGQYACRAFLATSTVDYDYLVEGVRSNGSAGGKAAKCYLDTGFKPVGDKTVCVVDCQMNSTEGQQSIFGVDVGLSFSAYINGNANSGGHWAFSCNNGNGDWNMPSAMVVSKERVVVTLDGTASPAEGRVVEKSTGESCSKTTTAKHTATATKTMVLWARAKSSSFSTQALATIYSCVITTNDGVCVRDFRPAVKDGVAGMWDAENDKFYKSAGSTALTAVGTNTTYFVTDGDVVVAQSPAWTQATSDYVTDTPYVEPLSLSFSSGGSKRGAAPLTLSGANNWGGTFTVYEGTLVADFGQGLASTDNLVLKSGTYCPLAAGTFTGSLGSGGGQISVVPLAEGGTGAGFSAYGHPLEVTLGGNAAVPLTVGPSSDPLFDVPLLLNDAYATDTLTFKNGIQGDGSTPTLTNIVGGATAVVEGGVNGVALRKLGKGTLVLAGDNSLKALYPAGGTLVISNKSTTVVNSGIPVNSGGRLEVTDGSSLDCTSAIRCGGSGAGTMDVDDATVTASGTLYLGPDNGSATAGKATMTNNASLTVADFTIYNGTFQQYGGKFTVTDDVLLGQGYAPNCIYELHGGKFEASSASGSFVLGDGSTTAYPKGYFRVYNGEAIVRAQKPIFGHKVGGKDKNLNTASGNYGYLQVYGGRFSVLRANNDATLFIGNAGFGIMMVTNTGVVHVEGGITVANAPGSTARTSTVNLLKGGTVRARWLRAKADPAVYTTTLVMDGATLIAQTNAAADFVSNFRNASVGVSGMTIDTAGQDVTIAQSFAARADQTWTEGATASDILSEAAFTVSGGGRLALTGTNEWLCATCVSNATLAVAEKALPAGTLRLDGGVIDLGGFSHIVTNLVGSGVVSNGTLVVAGTTYPGWADGGKIVVAADATLSTTNIAYAVKAETGSCGCIEAKGAIDVDGAAISVEGVGLIGRRGVRLVKGAPVVGTPVPAAGQALPLSVGRSSVGIGLPGALLIWR